MEMPAYHLPSFTNVFRRVVERTWMFLKKVLTIIIFVMIVLYFLLNFPGLGKAKLEANNQRAETIVSAFIGEIEANHPYALSLNTPEKIADYFGYDNAFSASKRGISDERKMWTINREFLMKDPEFFKIASKGSFTLNPEWIEGIQEYQQDYKKAFEAFWSYATNLSQTELIHAANQFYSRWEKANPLFFNIVRTGDISINGNKIMDTDAAFVSKTIRQIERESKALRKNVNEEILQTSFLGAFGKWIEPLTKYVGFNWKVNVGLIGALAAKENTVATLGSIYQTEDDKDSQKLGEKIAAQEKDMTPLHAAAMIIFMALYPPCLAALITISAEAGFKWMLFAFAYPTLLGFFFAFLLFTGGGLLGLSGMQAMLTLYLFLFVAMIGVGFVKPKQKKV